MKRLFLIISILLVTDVYVLAQKFRANEMFELSSIAYLVSADTARRDLPGAVADGMSPSMDWAIGQLLYDWASPAAYGDAIEEKFHRYANHPLAIFLRQMRRDTSLDIDDAIATAAIMQVSDETVRIRPGTDIDRFVAGRTGVGGKASPWTRQTLEHYVELLGDFYHDTDFHEFFDECKSIFAPYEQMADDNYRDVDFAWFGDFLSDDYRDIDGVLAFGFAGRDYVLDGGAWMPGHTTVVVSNTYDADVERTMAAFGKSDYKAFQLITQVARHHVGSKCGGLTSSLVKPVAKLIAEGERQGLKALNRLTDPREAITEWLTMCCAAEYVSSHGLVPEAGGEMDGIFDSLIFFALHSYGMYWMPSSVDAMTMSSSDGRNAPRLDDLLPQLASSCTKASDNAANEFARYASLCTTTSGQARTPGDRMVGAGINDERTLRGKGLWKNGTYVDDIVTMDYTDGTWVGL